MLDSVQRLAPVYSRFLCLPSSTVEQAQSCFADILNVGSSTMSLGSVFVSTPVGGSFHLIVLRLNLLVSPEYLFGVLRHSFI